MSDIALREAKHLIELMRSGTVVPTIEGMLAYEVVRLHEFVGMRVLCNCEAIRAGMGEAKPEHKIGGHEPDCVATNRLDLKPDPDRLAELAATIAAGIEAGIQADQSPAPEHGDRWGTAEDVAHRAVSVARAILEEVRKP